ncbi:MAG TPA: dipeptidase [Woeseiaceae bacterium]|jgi:microsomal dipeptidase-like Zn-dependent dipeptidase|nr:dipeptidase [Woeseiaceae bacterium]
MKRILLAIAALLLGVLGYVHWVLPGKVESSMNIVQAHEPYAIDDDARRLHDSLFVADLHSDSLLWKRDPKIRSAIGHMDLPRLREGNVALQVFSATTKSPADLNYDRNAADTDDITLLAIATFWPPRTWFSIYERAAYQLDKLHALARDGELLVVKSRQDLEELIARRQDGEALVGGLYLIEGAHPLEGDVDNLDRLFEQGLRIAGLTHFFDNELGGSLHGISDEGLSEFGEAVVRRANELGVIIDVAHASPAMVEAVLELSTAPVVLTHGGLKGICDTPRNLPDALMRRVAERGGLVGIGYWDGAVCDFSPAGIVKSIRYAIDLLGVEHVALGSDYDGTVTTAFDTSELAILTQTMLERGFSEEEIRLVMGGNVRRFLLENLPAG